MEHEDKQIASVETSHLNGFSDSDAHDIKDLSPIGPVVESIETNSNKESVVQSDMPMLLQVFKNAYDQRLASINNNPDLDQNKKMRKK
ncbi:uncharacterized protein CEXT_802341 [Caerostris extrusa]|uniref:Uncharacterized protein n=1 Tax=Caerostris extrusa TaxID=172846 RepID=A0AAV4PID0_CAEEX|nr:uncharacterized protein CEXT_802341 [Caerostris extrusa]